MDPRPIGVTDSGVGGLTVVRELLRLLPGEDIVYFGDSANCPYGNRPREELLTLITRILHLLEAKDVKLIALACNTMSTLIEPLSAETTRPLIGIIEPAARRAAQEGLSSVGVLATAFTVSTGAYDRAIAQAAPETAVFSASSPTLAALVDAGASDLPAIDAEIRRAMEALLAQGELSDVILGCTHYPILLDRFSACFPSLRFINPAREQAQAVRDRLAADGALSGRSRGRLTVCTSGDPQIYRDLCARLGILEQAEVSFSQLKL